MIKVSELNNHSDANASISLSNRRIYFWSLHFITGLILSFFILILATVLFFAPKARAASTGVVDDGDGAPAFVKGGNSNGQPSYFDKISSGYGGSATFTGNSKDGVAHNWATWSASVTGEVEVFASIPAGTYVYTVQDSYYGRVLPLTRGATYVISHAGGTSEIVIDQNANAGKVVSLGTYEFSGNGSVYLNDIVVETGNVLLSSIVFDAVSFGGELANLDITPPQIEDVKAHANNGTFIIQAKVTDEGSGVANAKLFFNGQFYTMNPKGDIYSAKLPYGANINLTYYIIATDNAGNTAVWQKGRGYVSIGAFLRNTGISPWAFGYGQYGCSGGNLCNSQFAGDPVNTQNGNLYVEEKLVKLGGRPQIDFKITYNSLGGLESIFGEKWTHTYNYHVLDMDNADYVGAFVQYPDGRAVEFSGSSYTPASGNFDKLIKIGNGFELISPDLTKIVFDADGDIKRWEDANGNGVNFEYGQKEKFTLLSQITSIKADGGRELKLSYGDDKHVKQIDAPEGKVLNFSYNDKYELAKYTDGNGGEIKFEYGEDHLMTKKLTPKGHAAFENEFDSEKRVKKQKAGEAYEETFVYNNTETKVTDANGKTITYMYNEDELLVKLTDALNKSISYEYNSDKKVKKMKDRDDNEYHYDYDSKGNRIYEKDPLNGEIKRTFDSNFNKVTSEIYKQSDHITKWEYDSKGNLKKLTNAKQDFREFSYNNFGQLVQAKDFRKNPTDYTYNSFGDLETETDALGNVKKFEYDGLGRMSKMTNPRQFSYSYTYDKNDNLLQINGPINYILKYQYDANNNLTKEVDANSGEIKYFYNKSEKVISKKNQLDFETKYIYGLMNEKLEEIDPEGRVTKYTNDPTYNVVEIKNAANTADEIVSKLNYNGMRHVTEAVDPESRITKFELDPLNRVSKEIRNKTNNNPDSENNVATSYEYSPTGAVLKVIDANNNPTTYVLDELDQIVKKTDAENQVTEYSYDEEGNVRKIKNPRGFTTEYVYDKLNRVEKIIDAKGGNTEFKYDPNSNLVVSIDANGVETKYEYNEFDRVSKKLENFIENGESDAYTNVKTEYKYDLHGNLRIVTNPRNYSTTFVYDKAHRNTQIVDAASKTTVFEYDKVDNLKKVTDRNGHFQTYDYDNLNRLVKATNAEGHFDSYTYDKVGNQIKFINKRNKTFTKQYDPLNRVKVATDVYQKTQFSTYDPIGNLLTFTDENSHTDRYEYDKVYRLRKSFDAEDILTEYIYDKNGNVTKKIDGEGNPTDFTYDELDRLTNKKNAENEEEKYNYDALRNLVLKYEADGTPHKYNYDNLYRLISVIDNYRVGESPTNDRNVSTQYQYDANGNLITQINPLSKSTKFEYNELDRLVKEINPLQNTWSYSYDFVGNRTKRVDANGATTNYSYYKDDILKQINYPTYNVEYSYSETNFPIEMKDNLGVTFWNYDDLDRLIAQKDPLNRNINYQYDFVGNIINLKQPDNRSIFHEYLKNDWLKKSTSSDNDQVQFTRNKVGVPTKLDRTNSSYSEISYDKVYRPLNVHDQQIGHGNHLISNFKYTYNDVGHITNEVSEYGWRQPSKVTTSNSYDGLHRLVEAKSSDDQWTKYSYDAAGNRTQLQEYIKNKREFEIRNSTYNDANQLLKIDIKSPMPPNVVTHEYKYDKNGNRIDKLVKDQTGVDRGVEYSYDFENRLIKAQDYKGEIIKKNPKDQGSYTINKLAHTDLEYDGNGRRLIKTYYPGASNPGKRTEYTFDRLDPIAQFDMWNGQYQNYYRDSNKNLMFFQGFKSQQDPKGTLYWYHYDGEGNIAATTKHQAQSDHTYRYDEYGAPLPENGNWTAPHNEYTLTQKEFDSNMNLIYFGARHYDPLTGTWISQDSYRGEIHNPMSLHRYMYNYDSPVNYVDKYGYSPVNCSVMSHPDCQKVQINSSSQYNANPNPYSCIGSTGSTRGLDCDQLQQTIQNLRNTLAEKEDQIRRNHELYNLPQDIKNAKPGQTMSVGTHQEAFKKIQGDLRKRLKEWNDKDCGDKGKKIPNDAWTWATRGVPVPDVAPFDTVEPNNFSFNVDWNAINSGLQAGLTNAIIIGGVIVGTIGLGLAY